ncbi:MAG: gamma-glutamyltransferase [Planctomycetes bacterium]|nr:gamma-glutamyltransferase [Planctomycetota bacterium]
MLGRVARLGCSLMLAGCATVSPLDEDPRWPTPARGMVVCEHPLATQVGVDVLERGGNAADAAVATALALAVVYPGAGNLGGGGFALWVSHTGEATALDFRECAPAGCEPELYLDEDGQVDPERSLWTPLAVGVPGSPLGLWELHRAHGSGQISFSELAAPAIALARSGFPVDPWLARSLRRESMRSRLSHTPEGRELFYPAGQALAEGQLLVQKNLARTLEELAQGGPRAFYEGAAGASIVATLRRLDEEAGREPGRGTVSAADLAAYGVRWRTPLRGWFRGTEVISMPPPSSGGVVLLQILSILEGFPLDAERDRALSESAEPVSERALHWWIEAMRVAFADRAEHLGDPDYHVVPLAELLSPHTTARRRIAIGEVANHDLGPLDLAPPREGLQTTHLSVLDEQGNALSMTTTLNSTFGSGIYAAQAGILLNNELDDFALAPDVPNQFGLVGSRANALAAGKRPLSSMTPTVLRRGGHLVTQVIGSPGGPRIISAVAQVILRTLVYGQSLAEAQAAPRIHQQWRPRETLFEDGWPREVLEALSNRRRHEVRGVTTTFGSVQAISVEPGGEPTGVSDPRRGGTHGATGLPAVEQPRPSD